MWLAKAERFVGCKTLALFQSFRSTSSNNNTTRLLMTSDSPISTMIQPRKTNHLMVAADNIFATKPAPNQKTIPENVPASLSTGSVKTILKNRMKTWNMPKTKQNRARAV